MSQNNFSNLVEINIPLPWRILHNAIFVYIPVSDGNTEVDQETISPGLSQIKLTIPLLGYFGKITLREINPNLTRINIFSRPFAFIYKDLKHLPTSADDYLQNVVIPTCFNRLLRDWDLWIENHVLPPDHLLNLANMKSWPDYANMSIEYADYINEKIIEIEREHLNPKKTEEREKIQPGRSSNPGYDAAYKLIKDGTSLEGAFKYWKENYPIEFDDAKNLNGHANKSFKKAIERRKRKDENGDEKTK